jgi:hypothetical protein
MSNDKAIAAVTKTLQSHLFKQLSADSTLAGAKVTTQPPDKARPDSGAGRQLNLFLYRTSINAAWLNQSPPGPGNGQPALPLILSYLLTAYGDNDDEVESHPILGLAMSAFNDEPLLKPADIAIAFPGSDLENQVERVRITPHPIPMDEISRLWATFQTGYRISVSYDVSVVLIDHSLPARVSAPVLTRGEGDAGPTVDTTFPPSVTAALPPDGLPAARPGDPVRLVGKNLAGVTSVQVTGARITAPRTLSSSNITDTELTLTIPDSGTLLPAGTVLLTPVVTVVEARKSTKVLGNTVALGLSPTLVIDEPPLQVALRKGAAKVTVGCSPPVLPGQPIALIVGNHIVTADTPTKATSTLSFELSGFRSGKYLLRLRVDYQDSIPIDVNNQLAFDANQMLELT